MSNNIGWCDCTINPVVGCAPCSPGCNRCYAARFASRLAKNPQTAAKYRGVVDGRGWWNGETSDPDWSCFARLPKAPRRVFVGSMTDIFYDPTAAYLRKLFALMASLSQHTFLLLTKRPENMRFWLNTHGEIPRNVWFGVTVCNQDEADAKLPVLMEIPARMRFVSIEPMLGSIDIWKWVRDSYECPSCFSRFPATYTPELCCRECGFSGPDTSEIWGDDESAICPKCGAWESHGAISYQCPDCGGVLMDDHPDTPYLDWVICGGESGPGARPMHPDWVRLLRDQCQSAGVPFYFKGWGGTKKAPALLDGREWREFPTHEEA